jgi:hypothetical protein
MDYTITHNQAISRFETTVEGRLAYIDYLLEGQVITFTHTYVSEELEGRGIAAALAKTALGYAAENELKVIPSCSYIRVYMERHPEYKALQ